MTVLKHYLRNNWQKTVSTFIIMKDIELIPKNTDLVVYTPAIPKGTSGITVLSK